jgi:rhomboid protease GluP
MPACLRCGKEFSGFSFGSTVPTECRECRRAFPQATVQAPNEFLLLGGSPPFVTRAIIAIDVLIFLAMGISGASWTEPGYLELVHWGADFGPLTLSGEWWRLLTSAFIHIGIIHIALNMWCLWDLGPILERLMGWKAFLVTYVVSGIAGSETSVAWRPLGGGAGASGAIFGLAGAFFSFLYFKKAPISSEFAKRHLKSVALFIFYNLFFGAVAFRVNNAAHVGGLIAGLILGAVIPCIVPRTVEVPERPDFGQAGFSLDNPAIAESQDLRLLVIVLVSALALVAGSFALAVHDAAIAQYGSAVALIRENDSAAAISLLQNATSSNPNHAVAFEMLGILQLDQGDPKGAWPVLRRAVDLDRNNLALRHNLALAYVGAGFPDYATQEIGWAIKARNEDRSAADFILGVASYQNKNYKDASNHFLAAVQGRRDFFEAQNALVLAYIATDQRDKAHALLTEILAKNSKDPVATGSLEVLATMPNGPITPDDLPRIVIPYSKLTAKSQYWPLFP